MNKITEKHPEIVEFFTSDWFKSEFKKKEDEMHLLARQFYFDDHISHHHIEHLETYLKQLREEIYVLPNYRKKLTSPHSYYGTLAEIEIAYLFKSGGFKIEFGPKIQNSRNKSDIKLTGQNSEIYIEVRTVKKKTGKKLEKIDGIEIREMKFHKSIDIKDKIEDEIHGLSKELSGIITLYLDPGIVNYRDFEKAFYDGIFYYSNGKVIFAESGESTIDNSIISALFLYRHHYNDEGCHINKTLFLNPKPTISINEKTLKRFKEIGIKCKKGHISK